MVTRQDLLAINNSLYNLPNDNSPIKKTWKTTVWKVMQDWWTVMMHNSKNIRVVYNINFQSSPIVLLQLWDQSSSVVYRTDVNSNSFTIKFKSNFTWEVERVATERP